MIEKLAITAGEVLYLFAPLLVSAALSAVVIRLDWLPRLRRPVDGGLLWRGKRLFGDSKTWRGFIVATIGCIATVWIQKTTVAHTATHPLLEYRSVNPMSFGAAMGIGAMIGELPNSFTKRRLGIPPSGTARGWSGVLFYIWDQVDLLTGCWPALLPWLRPGLSVVATSFALALIIHPVVALIGYLVGARRSAR